ncbi:DUF429 domain-containing protein [Nocardioides sp. zg-DK7169]|uniref:DUF429 domain-containing protein n=1 Tax=Nocardioides sp. zg-DK7169 TaxID=2736600 RepID=UPI0015541D78|nr:DUF429 domain-containing protein [Nocardioides sp. zg-DK7169]NPC97226.1 DUF429 domain-containing protein [Nocardioides sp. zg-DK7169]
MQPDLHLVGVDLAWGLQRPTGIAVLDAGGRLVHVAAVTSDDEVVAELDPYVAGPCVVAFDAPILVRNASGNRPAEAALNRDFARFEAGAHPSNTAKPDFRDGSRAQRLAARLGLDVNPRSGRSRRAIEVYPHPATVALFRLGRTLKYKDKKGRDQASMRAELLVLMGLLEGLAASETPLLLAGPAWAALRRAAESATRKSELRVVEDQVDAVVCAYVALLSHRAPERLTTYGDDGGSSWEDGYIVTPTLPADLTPQGPSPAAGGEDAVAEAVREYALRHPELSRGGALAVDLVTRVLDEAGINYLTVTGRTKSVASFAEKATRTRDGELLYPDPLRDITDQVGVRVVTYVHSDVAAVADLLASQVTVLDDRDMGSETAAEGRFGYASRHLLVELDPARLEEQDLAPLHVRVAQIQIRTVLQHAWAEFEHDIRYKGTIPEEHARDFDRRFTLAAGLLELADQEFSTIRDRLRGSSQDPTPDRVGHEPDEPGGSGIDARELAAFLAGQYHDAGWSRSDHYAWISGLLRELDITSLDELGEVIRPALAWDLNGRMEYRYPPGAVRRLDDALLAVYGERYVRLEGNAHRADLLAQRLERLRPEGEG